jgi:NTP pyrophosphatase (non-canonical NTP hydrolase)
MVNDKEHEIMSITQEECSEVIQAISKINRFGFDGRHPEKTYNNREHLEEEVGDVLAMIDLLLENEIVSWANVNKARRAKFEKLRQWSTIMD